MSINLLIKYYRLIHNIFIYKGDKMSKNTGCTPKNGPSKTGKISGDKRGNCSPQK